MTEFYERMNVRNQGKTRIADIILQNYDSKYTLIVDVGAGSCVIEQMLVDGGFKGSMVAIDKNPNAMSDTDLFKSVIPMNRDAILGVMSTILFAGGREKRIVFILSAVLHELTPQDRTDLFHLIRIAKKYFGVTVLIREPIFDFKLIDLSSGGLPVNTNDKDFLEYFNIHVGEFPHYAQLFANYCFAASYGHEAWEREKHEGRFTFTMDDISRFAKIAELNISEVERERDEFYKNTLPYGLYDRLNWTGTLIKLEEKE